MTITVGRFTSVEDPYNITQDGDRFSVGIDVIPTSAGDLHHAKAQRQQILGLVNDDDPIVPVTWTEDSTFDGYYRVVGSSCEPAEAYLNNGWMRAKIDLERVDGYSAPLLESTLTSVVRTNAHGITTASAVPVWAYPQSAVEAWWSGGGTIYSRTSADGTLNVHRRGVPPLKETARYYIAPASRYVGAATIEASYNGTYRNVIGAQLPAAYNTWRLSNGLIRITQPTTTTIAISCYDGSQWDTAKSFQFGGATTAGAVTALSTPRIVRNSPEAVGIRLSVAVNYGIGWGTQFMDLVVKRGARFVECVLDSTSQSDYYVEPASSEAGTALTGGFRATSNDAAGNRYVLASPLAQTNTLASGRLKATSTVNTFPFMIGLEVAGSGAATVDAAQELIYQYHVPLAERQMVVTR